MPFGSDGQPVVQDLVVVVIRIGSGGFLGRVDREEVVRSVDLGGDLAFRKRPLDLVCDVCENGDDAVSQDDSDDDEIAARELEAVKLLLI